MSTAGLSSPISPFWAHRASCLQGRLAQEMQQNWNKCSEILRFGFLKEGRRDSQRGQCKQPVSGKVPRQGSPGCLPKDPWVSRERFEDSHPSERARLKITHSHSPQSSTAIFLGEWESNTCVFDFHIFQICNKLEVLITWLANNNIIVQKFIPMTLMRFQ